MQRLAHLRFTSAQACAAAGIDQGTLKNWVSREPSAILLSAEDRVAAGQRTSFSFSFNRVMQIALTAQLVALGFQPRQAGMLAVSFTDVGHGQSGWTGVGSKQSGRAPGELFEDGWTVLLVHPGSDLAEVKNVFPGKAWDPFFSPDGFRATAVTINVNYIQWSVLQGLGFDRNGEPLQ